MKLGRGLDTLIPKAPQPPSPSGLLEIDLTAAVPNDNQPRRQFDETLLEELAESIRARGVIQPIIVTKRADGRYMIIEGERRWRASGLAGKKTIPAVVKGVDTEKERLELALITNAQREDLNAMELAHAYAKLLGEHNYRQDELSVIMGKSRSAVANRLRLLTLPKDAQEAIEKKLITEGHARAILSLDDKAKSFMFLDTLISRKLSVRDAEALAKKLNETKKQAPKKKTNDVHIKTIATEIEAFFHSKVDIKKKNKGGVIEIRYNSDDELDTIIKKIRGEAC